MPEIKLWTKINADKQRVFDLSRSIDLHQLSTERTHETAIAGKTSGLIELHESVTWRAKHFGIYQRLTVRITEFEQPDYFVDEMVSGAFREFRHEHHFSDEAGVTLMIDYFNYRSPLGLLGRLADTIFLEKYMTTFLTERNRVIKAYAESDKWKDVLIT